MSNIYFGFNSDGYPVRISRATAFNMYKWQTQFSDVVVNEVLDGEPAILEDKVPFLMVCQMAIREEAVISLNGSFYDATSLPNYYQLSLDIEKLKEELDKK